MNSTAGEGGSFVDLSIRFKKHLAELAPFVIEGQETVVVGVSGGLDSVVLLHLLRFGLGLKNQLRVVHVDHAMRGESASDAAWVKGLCKAWGLDVNVHKTTSAIATEEQGRRLRYDTFEDIRSSGGHRWIMTAHTADDQAETVLFRAARGSGPAGLAGVRQRWGASVVRPLLPFWRKELEDYGRSMGLSFRHDASNDDLVWTRNRLRHEVLPRLEEAVPGAKKALAALAGTCASMVEGSDVLARWILTSLERPEEGPRQDYALQHGYALQRDKLLEFPDPALTLLARRVCLRFDVRLGLSATRDLLHFLRESASGRSMDLSSTLRVHRSFDQIIFVSSDAESFVGSESSVASGAESPTGGAGRVGEPGADAVVLTADLKMGTKLIRTPRGLAEVRWRRGSEDRETDAETHRQHRQTSLRLPVGGLAWPLQVRLWLPGDRMRTTLGRKKVKKVLGEARMPLRLRTSQLVLVDEGGTVLWLPGVRAPVMQIGDQGSNDLLIDVRFTDQGRFQEEE